MSNSWWTWAADVDAAIEEKEHQIQNLKDQNKALLHQVECLDSEKDTLNTLNALTQPNMAVHRVASPLRGLALRRPAGDILRLKQVLFFRLRFRVWIAMHHHHPL